MRRAKLRLTEVKRGNRARCYAASPESLRSAQEGMPRMRGRGIARLNRGLAVAVLLGAWAAMALLTACETGRVESAPSTDVRTLVSLPSKEREHLRRGMRIYLDSLQGIAEALAERKMPLVAEHARKAGSAAIGDVPIAVTVTLPPGFVLLGMDTHQRFDALAAAASARTSTNEVMQQLRDILGNCTACHSSYRIAGR